MLFDILRQWRPTSGLERGRSVLIHTGRYRVPEDLAPSLADQAVAEGAGVFVHATAPTPPPAPPIGPRRFAGLTVIVAATGPSLTPDVAAQVAASGLPTIAVNDAHELLPGAAILYACDAEWWDYHSGVPGWAGERWSSHCADPKAADDDKSMHAELYGLTLIEGRHTGRFSTDPSHINYGDNSGYQAVNLAIVLGATRILMVGFDMRAVGGRKHFFGDHPKGLRNVNKYKQFMEHFERSATHMPAGITILNCTPDSALTCFPMMTLAEALDVS